MKKLSKVVMLPTEKASKIGKYQDTGNLVYNDSTDIPRGEFQHLYIVSDEEIKEGDWFIGDGRTIRQCTLNNAGNINFKGGWYSGSSNCKKIIATTDESLSLVCTCGALKKVPTGLCIKCGKFINTSIPRPSNEFLKKYCELGGINEVMIQYEDYLINPLTEQEVSITDTIAAEDLSVGHKLKVAPDNTITIYPVKK